MEKKSYIANKIEQMIRLEHNSSPTDKVLNSLTFWFGFGCLVLLGFCGGFFTADYIKDNALSLVFERIWFISFFFIVAFASVSCYFGIKQLMRQRYQSCVFGVSFSLMAVGIMIIAIVLCSILLHKTYVPFIYFPF